MKEILFGLTFVYGIIHLLTLTKLFDKSLQTITESLTLETPRWLKLIGLWFFYFSLIYQVIFWAKFLNII